jgi:hypothetical protein
MRAIKFRAREIIRGKRGKWVYGDYFSQRKDGVVTHYIIDHNPLSPQDIMWKVDPDTRGEHTGHETIDGFGVFEGDIVEHPGTHELRSVVVWNEEDAAFQLDLVDHEYGKGWAKPGMVRFMKLVGSIHDNPEQSK